MKPNIPVRLSVARCEHSAYTEYGFNQYHYLKGINKSARCFLFYLNGKPAGFCAVINQTFKGCHNGVRFHRIVVLPQFSHRGLGGMICDFIASVFRSGGYQMYMTCQSNALGTHMERQPNDWLPTANNKRKRKKHDTEGKRYRNRIEDVCFCYKFTGNKITGYENLLLSISELRKSNGLYIPKAISEEKIIRRLQKKQSTTRCKKEKSPCTYSETILVTILDMMNLKHSQRTIFPNFQIWVIGSIKNLATKWKQLNNSRRKINNREIFSG